MPHVPHPRWATMPLTRKIKWRARYPLKNSWAFADKLLAKGIAHSIAPSCKIAQVLAVPKDAEDFDLSALPSSYVFKANHGSHWLIRVKDGKDEVTGQPITREFLVASAKEWLKQAYNRGKEKQYVPIVPKVFFEEHLGKFVECRCFCFHGEPRFIMLDITQNGKVYSTIYDTEWKRVPAKWMDPEGPDIKRPDCLEKLISVARQLSKHIDFVRIDLYLKGDDVYFGEFTFTPNGGSENIEPKEFDRLWGSYWEYDLSEHAGLQVPGGIVALGKGARLYTRAHRSAYSFLSKAKHKLMR